MLVVLDGFGIGDGGPADATAQARTLFFRGASRYPHAKLETSGEAVGLPPGQMGNSEVGHMTMGAGRVIDQDITRISKAIGSGELETNQAIQGAIASVARLGTKLHLMGLVSDGGVHSHIEHLEALLELCGRQEVPVVLHVFLDGRDTPPNSGVGYVERLMPAPGPHRGARRDGVGPLLRHGSGQPLGARTPGLRRHRAPQGRGGVGCADGGPGGLRARRDRRVREADCRGRRRSRSATATP